MSSVSSAMANPISATSFGHSVVLEEKSGDLFSDPDATASIAHCVSACLSMSKGIATQFKKQFGGVDELKRQGKSVGDVAVLTKHGRFVYYLITKPKYYQKPTYATLEQALLVMRQHMVQHQVRRVIMPRIGCGLDKLQWEHVKQLLLKIFANMPQPCTITIYSL